MNDAPRISCLMPTRGRRGFMEQAIAMFRLQDYPHKELVIVEDGPECNYDLALGLAYHHLGNGSMSIGAKRNSACQIARGDILCLWDDDDRFGPHRLSLQAQPLLDGTADVSAMKMSLVYHQPTKTHYRLAPDEHTRLFAHDCRAGTLMCWARYYREGLRFPDASRGEDVAFLSALLDAGARLARLDDASAYVCVRHGGNVSEEMEYAGNPHFTRVVMEEV